MVSLESNNMSEFTKRKAALRERIDDLERSMASLKSELQAEEEREQHEAIDRLEDYLGDLDNKYVNLRDFWQVLREEMKELFRNRPGSTGKDG
jgi:chromosome segregation ATPase